MTELAQRIQAARKAKGLTKIKLAQVAGTGQAYLSRLEKEEKNPSGGMLTAIAKALDTTVSQLVGPTCLTSMYGCYTRYSGPT